MKLGLQINNLAPARATVGNFSDNNARNALSTALTRTARAIEGEWLGDIFSSLDRPTSFTARAVSVTRATADTLQAQVFIKDQPARPGAPAPVEWLAPQEAGGDRLTKKFERALMAKGAMPAGHKAVPGRYAQLDEYGNVSRRQITAVITQLGQDFSPGYAQTISRRLDKRQAGIRRHGRAYVAFPRAQGKRKAGIYERSGTALLPVFLFVTRVHYNQRTHFTQLAATTAPDRLSHELQRALADTVLRKVQRAGLTGSRA
jgi:hypothetical protein